MTMDAGQLSTSQNGRQPVATETRDCTVGKTDQETNKKKVVECRVTGFLVSLGSRATCREKPDCRTAGFRFSPGLANARRSCDRTTIVSNMATHVSAESPDGTRTLGALFELITRPRTFVFFPPDQTSPEEAAFEIGR